MGKHYICKGTEKRTGQIVCIQKADTKFHRRMKWHLNLRPKRLSWQSLNSMNQTPARLKFR
ncbi:MAG: hypothetical protein PHH07_01570, partial [Candidatus Cloacimonetes bacterium]|nr:hypothetical protein [Candidatus Cloacimonadota bacterium]